MTPAIAWVTCMKLAGHWFPANRFATVTGVALLLGNIGGITAGVPLAVGVDLFGWRMMMGVSGFLTLAYDPMKKTIAALRAENVGAVKYMIGGGQIDDQVMHYTEADGWGLDAIAALKFCNQWID